MTVIKLSATFSLWIQGNNKNHQQDQKSTVQNLAGTQLSVPSCFPFSDIASLGKVVTEGLAPLLYQMVTSKYPLSKFRIMHWNQSFLKSEDRKIERLVCTCMLLAGSTHTHSPSRRKGNQFAPFSNLYVVIDIIILHYVDHAGIHAKGEARYSGKLFQQDDRQSKNPWAKRVRPGTAASCLTKTTDRVENLH